MSLFFADIFIVPPGQIGYFLTGLRRVSSEQQYFWADGNPVKINSVARWYNFYFLEKVVLHKFVVFWDENSQFFNENFAKRVVIFLNCSKGR